MMQPTSCNKDSSLPKFVDHSNIDSVSCIFRFQLVSRTIIHIPIWRVTNYLTKRDVTSIRSLRNAPTASWLAVISSIFPRFEPPAMKLNNPGVSIFRIDILFENIPSLQSQVFDKNSRSRSQVSPHMPSLNAF